MNTEIPCISQGTPDYRFAFPLDEHGVVQKTLWGITWTKLHLQERWLQTLFATKYQRLNKFIDDFCQKKTTMGKFLPYDLVPNSVQVTRCFKQGVAYEVVVSNPTKGVAQQMGVIKIIPFGEHLEAVYKYQANIAKTLEQQKATTKFILHPWLETIALSQLSKQLFWGHINVDISDYRATSDGKGPSKNAMDYVKPFDRKQWLSCWNDRYVVIFMSKFHESVWNYFVTIQQTVSLNKTCTPYVQDIYGKVLWSLFAQIMFKTLPSYKENDLMCQNDSKIDNMMYLKNEVVSDLFIRVHSSPSKLDTTSSETSSASSAPLASSVPQVMPVILKIPTFKRIIHPMDFGFTSISVPNSPYQFVASLAALLYTNVDSIMNTNNLYTDYYQIMLSMLSFHKHFSVVKSPQFQSLMDTLLSILTQTLKLSPEQLKSAGTLATDNDVRTFYVDTSQCTINPLPLLLEAMMLQYKHESGIPTNQDPATFIVYDLHL